MKATATLLGVLVIALLLVVAAPGQAARAEEAKLDGMGQGEAVIVTINALPSGFIGAAPPIDVELWQVGGRTAIVRGLQYRDARAVKANAVYSRALVRAGVFRLKPSNPSRLRAGQQYCLVVMDNHPQLTWVGPAKATLEQAERDYRCTKLMHKFAVAGLG